MRLLVLGGGLMGPAAAFHAMSNPGVSQVIICDADQSQLEKSISQLSGRPGAEKLGVVKLDLHNQEAAVQLLANFDVALAALPQSLSLAANQVALQAKTPLVDLAKPSEEELLTLQSQLRTTDDAPPLILGCGVEPGLTEIVTRHLARQLDRVDEVHIKCGGIPTRPAPPLGYKIVFGGQKMPLHEEDALMVINGQLIPVPRYSGVESVEFADVGHCEAWHEGFMPWLLNLPALQNLRTGTQKTIRWPGYAAKIAVLKEMGLLSETPIEINGANIAPKDLLDKLLYPKVKLQNGEHDLTLFRVEVAGTKNGQPRKLQAEMVDKFDATTGFTSMARTTAFTGSIVAQMIGLGDISPGGGLIHPEQIITGPHIEQLFNTLAESNVTFKFS